MAKGNYATRVWEFQTSEEGFRSGNRKDKMGTHVQKIDTNGKRFWKEYSRRIWFQKDRIV